jgi:hypothetical protein
MILLDVLLHEQLQDIFGTARLQGRGLNAVLLEEHPPGVQELFGGRGAVVRIETTGGGALLVTPRGVFREEAGGASSLAAWEELVGYDWITPELAEKVEKKEEHYDRLFLHLRGERTVALEELGDAVYPLMTFLGKVLELRSQKVIRRNMDQDVGELVTRCLQAAVEGPFFSDAELEKLFEQERASLSVLAGMWRRMNLASPDLRRTVVGVMEMLLERRDRFPEAWDEHVGASPSQVEAAAEIFRRVVTEQV